jgi:hypothetical protein
MTQYSQEFKDNIIRQLHNGKRKCLMKKMEKKCLTPPYKHIDLRKIRSSVYCHQDKISVYYPYK